MSGITGRMLFSSTASIRSWPHGPPCCFLPRLLLFDSIDQVLAHAHAVLFSILFSSPSCSSQHWTHIVLFDSIDQVNALTLGVLHYVLVLSQWVLVLVRSHYVLVISHYVRCACASTAQARQVLVLSHQCALSLTSTCAFTVGTFMLLASIRCLHCQVPVLSSGQCHCGTPLWPLWHSTVAVQVITSMPLWPSTVAIQVSGSMPLYPCRLMSCFLCVQPVVPSNRNGPPMSCPRHGRAHQSESSSNR